jgi:putative MATE family efflux protein
LKWKQNTADSAAQGQKDDGKKKRDRKETDSSAGIEKRESASEAAQKGELSGKKPPMEDSLPRREIVENAVRIAWPSTLESFLVSLVGVVDTIMVGSLGHTAIAAVGLCTQPKFIGLAVFLSANVAVSAIVARRRGEQDPQRANRVLSQMIVLTLAMTAVISAVFVAFADPILQMAGSAPDTHEDAVGYFRIIMGGMVFNTLSLVINAAQRGAGNTKITMRTNLTSNFINVIFNYLLIGGNLGFPALGVRGAAIATVIGSIAGCGLSIASVMGRDSFVSLKEYGFSFRFDKDTMRAVADIGSSALVEQVFLRIGFLMYAMIVARLGTLEFAAHQVGMNIMSVSFSFGDGLSVAAVALVGRSLGEGRKNLAKTYGRTCQQLGLGFASILSVIFLTCSRPIFQLFSDEEEILVYSMMIMCTMSVSVFLQISQVVYMGCLRGAGDTKYTAFISLISVAIVRPGLGWLLCYPLGLGLTGAWIGLASDQFVRFVMAWTRFRRGKWVDRVI